MNDAPDQARSRSHEESRTGRRRHLRRAAVSGAVAVVLSGGIAAAAAVTTAGPQGDGTAITPVGYRVTPAGSQTTLQDLPLAVVPSPDGKMLLVSNDGQGSSSPYNQSVQVVDPNTSKVTQTIEYTSPAAVFYGLAFSPDGQHAYASGGGSEVIHTYSVSGGQLTEGAPLNLPKTNPSGGSVNMFPAGLQVTPDGKRIVVADHLADAMSVIDIGTGTVNTASVGHTPLGVALSPDGTTAWVANQGGNTVSVVDVSGASPVVTGTITVGTHPNGETLDASSGLLYVANGDSDQVSVINTAARAVVNTFDLAPYSHANAGTTPEGLSLSPDHSTLYVANAGNNDVAVIDLAQSRIRGLIPTGWYPTSVVSTASKLFVTNGKGLGAGPNNGPGYPDPEHSTQSASQYPASMMLGTLSTVGLPIAQDPLSHDTKQVTDNDGFNNPKSNPALTQPIQHVIYVVRENRTFDQEFGSLGKGNGDASLNLFGDDSAPNSRNLERNFTTLDNFYADAEVSAQGWNWDVAANSNPFSEQEYNANYSGRNGPYPSESNDPAIAPNANVNDAYIWDRLHDSNISFRNYGFYVGQNSGGQYVAGDPVLNANTDHTYPGFNLNCPDAPGTFPAMSTTACGPQPRINLWQSEFNSYVANNDLPTVEFVRLPNDHTNGTAKNKPTPKEYVADNDLALGMLVDSVSHSKYWANTAIFVTEDDAQNGPDHVDAHRTTSMLISPYTQTGKVDSTFYSTVSMLRTIEDIVGIRPLTQFDTYANAMGPSFTNKPDFSPYSAVRPAAAGSTPNPASAPRAAQSVQSPVNADQLNSAVLNEAIWKSVKGSSSTMPAPVNGLGSGTQDSANPGDTIDGSPSG